jgi:hypothetical protein
MVLSPCPVATVRRGTVHSPRNCRSVADDVEDLARSIRVHGLLTPLRLRLVAGGRYEVVAGERPSWPGSSR